MLEGAVITLFLVALILANLPWLNQRFFLFLSPAGGEKRIWMRFTEWFTYFLGWLILAIGVEKKLMGEIYSQGWEFYVVAFCLFVVFALPGFIYRHDLKPHLEKRERRSK